MKSCFFLLAVFLIGCGSGADLILSEEVDIEGFVTVSGKIPAGATLHFQPTGGNCQPASFTVKSDGSFSGKMRSGTYTYFISISEGNVKIKIQYGPVPESAIRGSLDRQVEVRGGKLQLTL